MSKLTLFCYTADTFKQPWFPVFVSGTFLFPPGVLAALRCRAKEAHGDLHRNHLQVNGYHGNSNIERYSP